MDVLSASVGGGGANQIADAKLVQLLLNNWLKSSQQPQLRIDGLVGPKTVTAITGFQRANNLVTDGRIDRAGPTIKALVALQATQLFQGVAISTIDTAMRRVRLTTPSFSAPNCQADLSTAMTAYFRELKRVL